MNFLPLPQGHGSLRPTRSKAESRTIGFSISGAGSPGTGADWPLGAGGEHHLVARGRTGGQGLLHPGAALDRVVGRLVLGAGQVGLLIGGHLLEDLDLGVHDDLDVVVVDARHQLPKHLVAVALPGHQRVLLAHGPEVDAFPEIVHLREVLAPFLVDQLQHHLPFEGAHGVGRLAALGAGMVSSRCS